MKADMRRASMHREEKRTKPGAANDDTRLVADPPSLE
jgi:hypothetical protein